MAFKNSTMNITNDMLQDTDENLTLEKKHYFFIFEIYSTTIFHNKKNNLFIDESFITKPSCSLALVRSYKPDTLLTRIKIYIK